MRRHIQGVPVLSIRLPVLLVNLVLQLEKGHDIDDLVLVEATRLHARGDRRVCELLATGFAGSCMLHQDHLLQVLLRWMRIGRHVALAAVIAALRVLRVHIHTRLRLRSRVIQQPIGRH